MHILSLPSGTAEPDIPSVEVEAEAVTDIGTAGLDVTVFEMQTPVSADLRNEDIGRGSITARNARIRSSPDISTNDNVVGWGHAGDRFTVLEEGAGVDGSKWYNVVYENGSKSGWISGSLVRLER